MTPAIQASELFYLYRTQHADIAALRGLTFELAAGEVVSALGPSGSGKTTLLTLCSGLSSPSSGELTVLGHRFERASARELARVRRTSIGIVRQHYHRALPRELTVEEIVALPLRLLGTYGRDERRRVAELVRVAGLRARSRARPAELSGGEQQRVAVCAALAKHPRLLLADEPTGELDARSTATVIDLLLELVTATGAAALIVTHDPQVALRTSRTIHVRDGRLAAEGTARPLLVVDEHGWLRIPRRLRETAGVRDRVRASAAWGKIELAAEAPTTHIPLPAPRPTPAEKRSGAEVALDRVSKRHDPRVAPVVANLSCTLGHEQLHVLAGPSGSGKTTVLTLLAALDYPDEGEIWVAGERIDTLSPAEAAHWRRKSLGYLSQHSTLVEFLSARENVELGLALRGFDRAEATTRAERALDRVGLNHVADRPADRLSGGEQRRVALARAVAPGPRLLLADEPTAHLDHLSARLVIAHLRALIDDNGTTVIAASHDSDLISAADTTMTFGPGGEPTVSRSVHF